MHYNMCPVIVIVERYPQTFRSRNPQSFEAHQAFGKFLPYEGVNIAGGDDGGGGKGGACKNVASVWQL